MLRFRIRAKTNPNPNKFDSKQSIYFLLFQGHTNSNNEDTNIPFTSQLLVEEQKNLKLFLDFSNITKNLIIWVGIR